MRLILLMILSTLASGCAYRLKTAKNTERAAVVYYPDNDASPSADVTYTVPPLLKPPTVIPDPVAVTAPAAVAAAQAEWMLRAGCMQTDPVSKQPVPIPADKCTVNEKSPEELWYEMNIELQEANLKAAQEVQAANLKAAKEVQAANTKAEKDAYAVALLTQHRTAPKREACLEFTGPGASLQSLDITPEVNITPAAVDAKAANGGAKAGAGTVEVSVTTSYKETYAQVYTVSEILLYGHAMSFRLCEARRNGDITHMEYADYMWTLQEQIDEQIRYVLETEREAELLKVKLAKDDVQAELSELEKKANEDVKALAGKAAATNKLPVAANEDAARRVMNGSSTSTDINLLGQNIYNELSLNKAQYEKEKAALDARAKALDVK